MTTPIAGNTKSFHWLPQFSLRQLMFLSGLFAFGVSAVMAVSILNRNRR